MIMYRLSLRWQKTVKESSRLNVTCSQIVPAKALLFGEYGLLNGGAAAVVLLPNFKFQVRFLLNRDHSNEQRCILRSEFLSNEVILDSRSLQSGAELVLTGEQRNFYCYLSQYRDEFANC
ncbi:MAG: hypothetical protein RJB13_1104, partial [Pseudomonadota bacterium]